MKEPAFEDITLESERKRIFKDFMHVLEVILILSFPDERIDGMQYLVDWFLNSTDRDVLHCQRARMLKPHLENKAEKKCVRII